MWLRSRTIATEGNTCCAMHARLRQESALPNAAVLRAIIRVSPARVPTLSSLMSCVYTVDANVNHKLSLALCRVSKKVMYWWIGLAMARQSHDSKMMLHHAFAKVAL